MYQKMSKRIYSQLDVYLVLCIFYCVLSDSMSGYDSVAAAAVSTTTRGAVTKRSSDKRTAVQNCEQLPLIVLAELLGEAYNSRYMSVNWPISSDEVNPSKFTDNNDRNAYLIKRKIESIPSFYVSEEHTNELSEKPAWDVRGLATEIEMQTNKNRRKKRELLAIGITANTDTSQIKLETNFTNIAEETGKNFDETNTIKINEQTAAARNKRQSQRTSNEQWRCETKIKWVDLGTDYFPRFIRTAECTKPKCYYEQYLCKPKSFAVKILHRRRGMCADAGNLKKISSFDFRGEFGEVWKWEEVAINFCCDCVVLPRYA